MIVGQNAFAPAFQRFKFHMTDGQNNHTRDQSAFCTFHTFLVEVQINVAT